MSLNQRNITLLQIRVFRSSQFLDSWHEVTTEFTYPLSKTHARISNPALVERTIFFEKLLDLYIYD